MRATEPLIEARDATVGAEPTAMLRPVSFRVGAGTGLAVTGPNGSGKTTLLAVLAGLTRPDRGSVRISGAPVDERSRELRRTVAALIGTPPLARNLTLDEHLQVVASSWGADLPAARERARAGLEELGIGSLAQRFVHELSSGQSQLFSLALTLVRPFRILLLDEPEQRLDEDRLALVGTVLRRLVDAGRTVVLATHSAELARHVADRTFHLPGEIGALGELGELGEPR